MNVSKFIVSTVFRGNDQLTPTFKNMGRGAQSFGSQSQRAFRKAAMGASTFKSVLSGILAAGALRRIASMGTMAIRDLSEEYISFEKSIVSASAKHDNAKFGSEGFDRLKNAAREAGATTEFTATEAADGLNKLAMSAFTLDQSIAALPGVIDLATNSEMDLAFAAQASTDALEAFNLKTDDSEQLAINLTRVNDVLAKTFTTSSASIVDLAETMKYGGAVMKSTGASIEDFAMIAGAIAKAGIRGSMGGTTIRQMFLRLQAPTKTTTNELRKLGVQIEDKLTGAMRSPLDIFTQFAKKTEKMGDMAKGAALKKIFETRAITGFNKILSLGVPWLESYLQKQKEATGTSQKMADVIRQSLSNRLATLKSSLIDVGFEFIAAFEKHFPDGIDSAIRAVRKFDIGPIITDVKIFIQVLKEVYEFTKNLTDAVKDTVQYYEEYHPLLKDVALAVGTYYVAAKIATGIQWAFNAALAANPIGLIVAGMAAWVYAIKEVVDNYGFLKSITGEIIDGMIDKFNELLANPFFLAVNALLLPWLTIPALIYKKWFQIKLLFDEIGGSVENATDWMSETAESMAKKVGIDVDLTSESRERKANEQKVRESIAMDNKSLFEAKLTIANAPEGSKVESKSKGVFAKPVSLTMLGLNKTSGGAIWNTGT